MLPAEHRMRRSEDFSRAVRQGRRSGSTHLVAHLWIPAVRSGHVGSDIQADASGPVDRLSSPTPHPARVGFVVSKAIGNAVMRTSVKRRLRAVSRTQVDRLPVGALLVIRANPAAAGAPSTDLARSLERSLARLQVARPQVARCEPRTQ